MSVNPGELYHTTRGIAEIQQHYVENGVQKVRFLLHLVDEEDGVTATGQTTLMSAPPENLQRWIDRFPKDLEERRRTVAAQKNFHPNERDRLDGILARIEQAQQRGPQTKDRRPNAPT